jgi:hypothetical protein
LVRNAHQAETDGFAADRNFVALLNGPGAAVTGSKLDGFNDLLKSSVISIRRRSAKLIAEMCGLQTATHLPVWMTDHAIFLSRSEL